MNIDAVTLLNTIGKYVDESNIENFLKDINFYNLIDYSNKQDIFEEMIKNDYSDQIITEIINHIYIEDLIEDPIFETILSNKKGIVVLKAISIKDLDNYIEDIDFSNIDPTVLKLLESKIDNEITEDNIDIIDQILNSNLVDFNRSFSIEKGYCIYNDDLVTNDSKLSNEICKKLVHIYMKEHEWRSDAANFYYRDYNSFYEKVFNDIYFAGEFRNRILENSTIEDDCLAVLEKLGYDISKINKSTTFDDIDITFDDYIKYLWEVFYIW